MYRLLAALRPQWATSTDAVLLHRFHTERDEAAFAELVRRYGPIVWGVCRRGLTNPADEEDAFQATFLVLVRRVHDVVHHPALGPWLHRVALHTVRNGRRLNRRRTARVGPLTTDVFTPDRTPIVDARLDVDTALARLPERLRVPVVLCHLQGLTRSEAAARLGCPEGTLSANLAEALRRLRQRLSQPDVPSVLAIAGAAMVPTGLASASTRAAIIYSTSTKLAAGVSPTVVILTEGVLRMFWLKKLVTVVAVAVLGIGVTAGVGYRVGTAGPDEPAKASPVAKAKEKIPEGERIRRLEQTLNKARRELDAQQVDNRIREDHVERLEAAVKQAKAELAKNDKSDRLELVIDADGVAEWGSRCRITEWSGGLSYTFNTQKPEDLRRLLSYIAANPKAPKTLSVNVGLPINGDLVRRYLLACREAGFKTVKYDGPLDSELMGIAKGPGAWVYDQAKRYEGPIDLSELKNAPVKPE